MIDKTYTSEEGREILKKMIADSAMRFEQRLTQKQCPSTISSHV